MTLWSETDERVLRWVASLPFSYANAARLITLRSGEPMPDAPELEGLDWKQIDASLRRLKGEPYKFIDGRESPAGDIGTIWGKLRITAQGLQRLDEWPDFERIASAVGMQALLNELAVADDDPGNRTLLQRAGSFAGKVLDRFIKSEADSLTSDAVKEVRKEL